VKNRGGWGMLPACGKGKNAQGGKRFFEGVETKREIVFADLFFLARGGGAGHRGGSLRGGEWWGRKKQDLGGRKRIEHNEKEKGGRTARGGKLQLIRRKAS